MIIDLSKEIERMGFEDVYLDQFFIDEEGYLCQKCTNTSCNIIANPDGTPNSLRVNNIKPNSPVKSKFDLSFKLNRKS